MFGVCAPAQTLGSPGLVWCNEITSEYIMLEIKLYTNLFGCIFMPRERVGLDPDADRSEFKSSAFILNVRSVYAKLSYPTLVLAPRHRMQFRFR